MESTAIGQDELGAIVRATVGGLYRRFRSERAPGELGDATIEVLTYLEKHGPESLTGLSAKAGVAPASMSQSVNRLAAADLVERTRSPEDRRTVLIGATPAGVRLARDTRATRNQWLDAQLRALSMEDRAAIARACALFADIAGDGAMSLRCAPRHPEHADRPTASQPAWVE